MFQQRIGWIGIDIGSHCVKLAQMQRDGVGQLRLRQGAVVRRETAWSLANASVGNHPHSSHDELVAAFDYGLQFVGPAAACVLPMHIYDLRGANLPQGDWEERRNMLIAEMSQTSDFDPRDCEFDFWETELESAGSRPDEPNVSVLSVSTPWVEQLALDAGGSRLQLQVLDGPPLAMARAVQLALGSKQTKVTGVVDWGFSNTTFSVVHQGRPLFTRRVRSCGVHLVQKAVAEGMGVSDCEALHLLINVGLPNPTTQESNDQIHPLQLALADAAQEPLNKLAAEIRRTMTYFSAQRHALIPEKVFLQGGGADIVNVDHWLTDASGADVTIWRLPTARGLDDSPPSSAVSDNEPFSDAILAKAMALSALPLMAA